MIDWLQQTASNVFAQIVLALEKIYQFFSQFDPIRALARWAYEHISYTLPPPDYTLQAVMIQYQQALIAVIRFFTFLDYFVDVRFFFGCLALMLALWLTLMPLRVWRAFVRSLVT